MSFPDHDLKTNSRTHTPPDYKDADGDRQFITTVQTADLEAYPIESFETEPRVDAVFGVQDAKGPNYRSLGWYVVIASPVFTSSTFASRFPGSMPRCS
jgi:hypothetical protein